MAAEQTQENTLSHTAQTLGDEAVELYQNKDARQTAVISFTNPREFEQIDYVGRSHATRFVPRCRETMSAPADGVASLDARIQPVAGEPHIEDQDYPAVVAYNVTQGAEIGIEKLDYAQNEVHLNTNDIADTDDIKLFPIITEGEIQYQGVNQFDQLEGPAAKWQTPVYRFHDMEQDKRGTEVNLDGSVTFSRHETLEFTLESPRTLVWEDADYPGSYVSTFQQKVDITL